MTQQSKENEDTGQGCRMKTGMRMMRDSNEVRKTRARDDKDNNNDTTIKK